MKRNRRGFVLVELLAAVAVLIVTFSITSVNAGEINKQLNQSKAVSTARDIFIEAQYNLTALKASGKLELLNDNDGPLSQVVENSDLSFITSQNDNKKNFINDEEYGGSYIIEFDPTTGMVAGVWWASKEDLNGFNQMLTPDKKYKELDEASNTELLEFADKNKYNIYHYTNDVSAVIASSGPGDIPETPDPQKEPETPISTGFCYYEVYEDGGIGTYIFAKNEDNLKPSRNISDNSENIVIGDGYGVILKKDSDASKVSVSGTRTIDSLKSCQTLAIDGGYIYMFPASWMCANKISNENLVKAPYEYLYDQSYWEDVAINYNGIEKKTNESWSYSPYYAKSAVTKASVNGQKLPTNVYIRSARQLNALSWLYSAYYNQQTAWGWNESRVLNTTFVQEMSVDYAKYKFSTYTGRSFVGQLPIGTDWGRFISNYNGKDNNIYNIKLYSRNKTGREFKYAGLFGFVSVGTIENVNVVSTGATFSDGSAMNTVTNADYCGILAAYVQNATVKNCTVQGYKIIATQSAPYETGSYGSVNYANEYNHSRFGGLIGYIKCPAEDYSAYYTTVQDCDVINIYITTDKQFSRTSGNTNSRGYHIGGFVGSVCDYESNKSRRNHITIKNCTVTGTIDTSSYGKDFKQYNIGGFAGGIGLDVNLSLDNSKIIVNDGNISNHYQYYKQYQ